MNKLNFLLVLIITLGVLGCSDINESLTDGYNDNPNAPSDSPPEELFIGAQTAAIQFFEGHAARLANMWTQHATGVDKKYAGYNSYNIGALDFDYQYSLPYTAIRSNLGLVLSKSQELGNKENLVAVSNIMDAMVMGTVTSLWGDIPYSEANQEMNSDPVYDAQDQIYNQMQVKLDDAISLLESNSRDLPEEVDIFSYNGDVNKWIKAAYTLKARFSMHVGNYDDAIQSAEKGILALNGEEDLNILHGDVLGGNANIYYQFITGNRSGYLDASQNHAYPLMQDRNNSKTVETGRMNFFYTSDGKDLNISEAFSRETSYPLITAVENYLILAEAYARKETSQDNNTSLSYLNEAREYNQEKFPESSYEDLSTMDFQSGGEYENTTILQEILDEEYLSLAFQIEVFNFCRRVDFSITGLSPVSGQSAYPERFLYSQQELNSNSNAPEQQIDDLFTATPVNEN